jgi:hypothetical protein
MKHPYSDFIKELNVLCEKYNMCIFSATDDGGIEKIYLTSNAISNFRSIKEEQSGFYYLKEKKKKELSNGLPKM